METMNEVKCKLQHKGINKFNIYHLDGKIVWNALKWASWPKELIRCHLFNNSNKKKKKEKKCVWR